MTNAREGLAKLAEKQNEKAEAAKSGQQRAEERQAAETIQRNYRGYRDRRTIKGLGLSPSTRWVEAVKEVRYRNATRPLSRDARSATGSSPKEAAHENARKNWARATQVARRAGADDISDDEDEGLSPEEMEKRRAAKLEAKHEQDKTAKMMDLQYFLEMVDEHHRYGSNLRAYHNEWKRSDTNENFFYWLDQGEGRNIEVPTVPRSRLDSEKVRYLSREERQKYLVKIDQEGRLCWAKNGMRITTDSMEYKDSVDGIVPKDDATPAFGSPKIGSWNRRSDSTSSASTSNSAMSLEAEHYVNHDLQQAKGIKKVKHVSAATILNHLLQKSVKPNSWIFAADTSFRLYIGIKQSGAFQHSSFLHGSRISAAGLIKIKDGQLRRLSPLSGHYRPPTANFRAFVHSLRDAGVDMSRVSISRSYAVLVGLEAYVRTRKKFKHGFEHVIHGKDKVFHPEEVRKREEAEKDKSKSAQREREVLAAQDRKREQEMRDTNVVMHIRHRLQDAPEQAHEPDILSKDGQDAEAAIPPEGGR